MAGATQYSFDLLEVGEILLNRENIREGLWTVGVMFAGTPAEAGPNPESIRPSMVISVDKFLLTRADKKGPLVIDASEKGKTKRNSAPRLKARFERS